MQLVLNTYLSILLFLPVAALATWRISVFLVLEEGPFGLMAGLRYLLGVRQERVERKGVPGDFSKAFEGIFDKTLKDDRDFEEKYHECLAIFLQLEQITIVEPTAKNPLGKVFTCVWCMSFWVSILCAWPIALLGIAITPAMGFLVALATSALAIGYDRLLRRA